MDDASSVAVAVAVISIAKLMIGWLMYGHKHRKYQHVGTVSSLRCYPVKSCQAVHTQQARATVLGLNLDGVTDRHWLITKYNGDFISQRQCPEMALISVSILGNDIQLDAPGMTSLTLPKNPPLNKSKVGRVRVWETRIEALHCGQEASDWVSKFLGIEGLQMGFFAPGLKVRDTSNEPKPWGFVALPGDLSAYSDFGAYLVTNEASLEDLNERLEKKVTMTNFRPNIVIKGCKAFDEDNWLEIRIGDKVYFRVQDPCTRCSLTTVDPEKGVKDPKMEPLATLKKFRGYPPYEVEGPCFGVNAAIDYPGNIQVGDPVYVLRK
ncbi:hypothetical protein FSP39_007202 [Pinctada imbricata]|uniref:MOSC domain-containing protein n=1 Tax=Pinctada imbricata TaxID=66713 RepID=A0AA89C341_PINIB|nr:hypothetical protein FSP39_007202 [Pinctada imbricata]